ALVTVLRTTGTDGTVSVQYAATAGTAVNGVNFTAEAGTLTFGPGQTTATFQVPVYNDHQASGNHTVNLALSNPTGGATIGTPSAALLTVDEVSPAAFASGPTLAVPGQPVKFTLGATDPNPAVTTFTYQIDW